MTDLTRPWLSATSGREAFAGERAVASIAARIERLPIGRWHFGILLILGLATIRKDYYSFNLRDALSFASLAPLAGLVGCIAAAYLIDRVGRRKLFITNFLLGGVSMLAIWLVVDIAPWLIIPLAVVCTAFIGVISPGRYLYTPELFPTRLRAIGTSIPSFGLRLSSLLGGLVYMIFAIETANKVLEDLSP